MMDISSFSSREAWMAYQMGYADGKRAAEEAAETQRIIQQALAH